MRKSSVFTLTDLNHEFGEPILWIILLKCNVIMLQKKARIWWKSEILNLHHQSKVYFKELKREYLGNDLIQKLGLESGCHKFGPQVFWRWQNNPNATRHFWNGHSSCRSKKNISSPNLDKNDEMCPRNPRSAYHQNLNLRKQEVNKIW